MQRADEVKTGAKTKADAHIDADKMVRNHIRKEEKKKRKVTSV